MTFWCIVVGRVWSLSFQTDFLVVYLGTRYNWTWWKCLQTHRTCTGQTRSGRSQAKCWQENRIHHSWTVSIIMLFYQLVFLIKMINRFTVINHLNCLGLTCMSLNFSLPPQKYKEILNRKAVSPFYLSSPCYSQLIARMILQSKVFQLILKLVLASQILMPWYVSLQKWEFIAAWWKPYTKMICKWTSGDKIFRFLSIVG